MRRLLLGSLTLLALASAVALAAPRDNTARATGRISALDASSITVAHGHHSLTCTVNSSSPDTSAFHQGEEVRVTCGGADLVSIEGYPVHHRSYTSDDWTAGLSGTLSGLGDSSLTVTDGGRSLTCALAPGSPSTSGFAVGDHVVVGCANGALSSIHSAESPTTTTSTTGGGTAPNAGANGPISALTSTSIGVEGLTCSIAPGSPSTNGFAIGDAVRLYCLNGALLALYHDEVAPTPTTTEQTTTTTSNVTDADGTVAELSSSSITVGDLTCTIGTGSPSTSDFPVGTPVRMYCLNGALYRLYLNEPSTTTSETTTQQTTTAPTTTTTSNVTDADGTVAELSSNSITVGDLTCTIGTGSPSTTDFPVGTPVRMYCLNGALYRLYLNEPSTTTSETTTQQTTTAPTTTSNISGVDGTIGALSSSSITVGDLSCTIGAGSPSTSGFSVGESVALYCESGALYALIHR